MLHKSLFSTMLTLTILCLLGFQNLSAQSWEMNKPVRFAERNMGGPRLGVTYIPGNGELVQKLKENQIGNTISPCRSSWPLDTTMAIPFEYYVTAFAGNPVLVKSQ